MTFFQNFFKEHIMHYNPFRTFIGLVLVFYFCVLPLHADTNEEPYFNPAVGGPESPSYWVDLGGLYATYGSYQAAVKAYEKALNLDPNSSTIYYDLAVAQAELGHMDQALDYVNKAISMAPDQDRYYYARARILLLTGRLDRAVEDFRKAAGLGNPDAIAYLNQ